MSKSLLGPASGKLSRISLNIVLRALHHQCPCSSSSKLSYISGFMVRNLKCSGQKRSRSPLECSLEYILLRGAQPSRHGQSFNPVLKVPIVPAFLGALFPKFSIAHQRYSIRHGAFVDAVGLLDFFGGVPKVLPTAAKHKHQNYNPRSLSNHASSSASALIQSNLS